MEELKQSLGVEQVTLGRVVEHHPLEESDGLLQQRLMLERAQVRNHTLGSLILFAHSIHRVKVNREGRALYRIVDVGAECEWHAGVYTLLTQKN